LVVAFQTSFSLDAEHEVRPAPVMVLAMLKVVVVAFVDVLFVEVSDAMVPVVAPSVVANRFVEVAFVEVLLIIERLVMVEVAELTRMPSPTASGER
jgi:hypothetical protein